MTSQIEAIALVINQNEGNIYITIPTKNQSTPFTEHVLNPPNLLLESNEPFKFIEDEIIKNSNDDVVTTVITTPISLFHALPTLSSLSKSPVVIHIDRSISPKDYSSITTVRDLGYPVLISNSTQRSYSYSSAAYQISLATKRPIFHFFQPPAASEDNLKACETAKFVIYSDDVITDIFDHYGIYPFEILSNTSHPTDALVYLGAATPDFIHAASNFNILLININVYRPFCIDSLLSLLPRTVRSIHLVQQSPSQKYSPLALDFFANFSLDSDLSRVITASFASIDNYSDVLQSLLRNSTSESPIQNLSFGKSLEPSDKSSTTEDIASAHHLEQAYVKLLYQITDDNLTLLNRYLKESVGPESNPEYGFGLYLKNQEQLATLKGLVRDLVSRNTFDSADAAPLIEALSLWTVALAEKRSDPILSEKVIRLLKSSLSSTAQHLLQYELLFNLTSNWLVGSDAWSYDLGSLGVHNVISLGRNINMLLIDSQPYDSAGKTVHGFRKKDVGLYAMNAGTCYVASVAIYSSYTQVLQALLEAEKFDGPSIVLAYLPYHSERDSTLEILQQTKKAVDSGYWPLYRYNPLSDEDEKFKLDSSNLRKQLKDFLSRENKLSLLAARNPVLSRNLTASANSQSRDQQQKVAAESFAKLVLGLSGPPLLVVYASDGGNAEGIAKKINRQALGRGLKSTVLAMDDYPFEDLSSEPNVLFVTATSGQGEFPGNGKQFWDQLKNTPDLDLSSVRFLVFAMGDSEYWPRKEDKHYFNKPGKDLNAKLDLYGAVRIVEIGMGDDQDADGYNTAFNAWIPQVWKALGVDNVDGVEEPKPLTNEDMKIGSDFLRGTIAPALVDELTGAISAVDQQLTKFHGIYMQDDRDVRDERKAQGLEPAYAFMIRVRLPGGMCTPAQYLKMDQLLDERGNGTIKITTRATFQLHGVVKHDMKPAIRGMNAALMDTLAACGDVNRNVMVSALPGNAKIHSQVAETGLLISEHLLPSTTAYYEIWLEGADLSDQPGDADAWNNRKEGPTKKKTLVAGNALVDVEPLYGPTYLPRKFKIVITVPPYNDVDVYAHDIGLIAIVQDNEVIGYNLLAGGGMGTTHNNKKTYPRLASMFGYVPKHLVHIACEKVMLVQRDHGDRTNRKHARLKYTIDTLGVDVFKQKVEELLGFPFEEPKPFTIESNVDTFGWCTDENGLHHFTAFIENGRIENTADHPQKTGLKEIAQYLQQKNTSAEFRLTGNQHLLVSNIAGEDLAHVKALLAKYKLDNSDFSALRLSSAACVAFPTCGLAMAESERYLPQLISKLETALEEYGLRHDSVVMRMTGCPNGCARPWVAEVALVGKAYGAYNLLLGGGHHGERLNKIYRYSIKEEEVLRILLPLFKLWSLERQPNEPFGDFVIRTGVISPTTEGRLFYEGIPIEA